MSLFRRRKDGNKTAFADHLAKTLATTSKQLVWLFAINGIAWIWCSYILAFMGRDQIAEALSGDVCKIVLGQMGCYLITKTVENVFQYNDIFGPKANGIITPIPTTSETPSDQSMDIPLVQTSSPSVKVENTIEEEMDYVADQLDTDAAVEPD